MRAQKCSICNRFFLSDQKKVKNGDNFAHKSCIDKQIPLHFQKLKALKDEQWNNWESQFDITTTVSTVVRTTSATSNFISTGTPLDPRIIRAAQCGTKTEACEVVKKISSSEIEVVQSAPQQQQQLKKVYNTEFKLQQCYQFSLFRVNYYVCICTFSLSWYRIPKETLMRTRKK